MRTKLLTGLPIGLLLTSAAIAIAPAAQADSDSETGNAPYWTCTAQTYDGHELPAVDVPAKRGVEQARMRARPEWRGQARFDTIACVPKGR
ncbi:hypothetical protein NDR87_09415 [Nocardia sp. CDC159]|uniref:Secreted protein n=1 Tax=Nocardia pulmonis TaxID=2951408 RepID=A0A9X2E8J3_9NOCA|nr:MULTISPECIES: hypothetical protein [Nocardia]MCM6773686.1 hypothetical protein [Nocardia pulmonis]MCM6786573.1 hypothetical protein [Nocardia sp. CDC159]